MVGWGWGGGGVGWGGGESPKEEWRRLFLNQSSPVEKWGESSKFKKHFNTRFFRTLNLPIFENKMLI